MKVDALKSSHTIEAVLASNGITLAGAKCRCPFHQDKTPSFTVKDGKWKCWAGCGHGDVIDLMAKFQGKETRDLLREMPSPDAPAQPTRSVSAPAPVIAAHPEPDAPKGNVVAIYQYHDANGRDAFQAVRMEPKDFRQRKSPSDWTMKGVERVLYRLPKVRKAQTVWVCFSQDTEVLTERGWLAFPLLTCGHKIAQFDNGIVSFVTPMSVQKFSFDGELVSFRSRWADFLVTPDHPMLVRTPLKGKNRWSTPREAPAESVRHFWKLPTSGHYAGRDSGPTLNQARLLASIQADGSFPRGFHLEWNLKKERKKERLRVLLRACGLRWREKNMPSSAAWTLFIIDDRRRLSFLRYLPNKHFSWGALHWPLLTRRALLEELQFWDGDRCGPSSIRFFTSNSQDAEIISALAPTSGMGVVMARRDRLRRSNHSAEYVLNLNLSTWRTTKKSTRVPYIGEVYCCTVPSHAILVRRNGKCVITKQCEGEKDVESLEDCGFTATTSIGGSNGWLDSYGESLRDKDLILCGDNDEPGDKYMAAVEKTVTPLARSVRRVRVPSFCKDVSDYLASLTADEDPVAILNALATQAEPLFQGETLPIFTMEELEARYIEYLKRSRDKCLMLGKWLPSLNISLVPGELLVILADTGVGKTAILGNIFTSNSNLQTILFELELAESKIFQRMVQKAAGVDRYRIEQAYALGGSIPWRETHILDKLVVAPDSCQSLEKLDSIIKRSELKTGQPPALVLLDYIQLVGSKAKDRYSRFSDVAEGLKRMAKERNVVMVCASQVARDQEREYGELSLHAAKESGSIENSAGTVLGVSRNPNKPTEICIQVLKSTDHGGGAKHYAHFDFKTMRITETIS